MTLKDSRILERLLHNPGALMNHSIALETLYRQKQGNQSNTQLPTSNY